MFRLGIDLGGSSITVGVVDDAHRILARTAAVTPKAETRRTIPEVIAACAQETLAAAGIQRSSCIGAGLGTPGICDTGRGVVRYAHNLGWNDFSAADALQKKLDMPVRIANDGNCAALGEAVAGAAKGCESALVLTLGTGVGGGFVLRGKLCAGHNGLGGEFGHIRIAADGEKCSCGEFGCWEAYASATALVRQAARAASVCPDSALHRCGTLSGSTVYAAAASGDPTARSVTEKYAEYVGMGLVSLINVLFPEIVLIGGGIANAGEALFGPVREYVHEHSFVRDRSLLPPIRAAALGNDAGIIGAAALITDIE